MLGTDIIAMTLGRKEITKIKILMCPFQILKIESFKRYS
jgi:hypothetical protein